MSRTEVLLELYRLAICPPAEDAVGLFSEWLLSRQRLMDRLSGASADSPFGAPMERALAALIVHADSSTFDRLVACKRQIAALMKRQKGWSQSGLS